MMPHFPALPDPEARPPARVAGPAAAPGPAATVTPAASPRNGTAEPDTEERVQVLAAQAGDAAAVGWLYDRYYDRLYRYVLFKVDSAADAEDIVGTVFLRMIEALPGYRWQGVSFAAWLYRIAYNQILDQARRRTRHPHTALDPLADLLVADGDDPFAAVAESEERGYLRSALERLPDLQARVIALRFGAELPLADTAVAMDRTLGAVKALQFSALRNLARDLAPLRPEPAPRAGRVPRRTI